MVVKNKFTEEQNKERKEIESIVILREFESVLRYLDRKKDQYLATLDGTTAEKALAGVNQYQGMIKIINFLREAKKIVEEKADKKEPIE